MMLNVCCPHLGIVKKMRVSNDVSFAEVLSRFGEKNAVEGLGDYEVIIQGQERACNPLCKLADFIKEPSVSQYYSKALTYALTASRQILRSAGPKLPSH